MLAQLAQEDYEKSLKKIISTLKVDESKLLSNYEDLKLLEGDTKDIHIDLQCVICFKLPNISIALACNQCSKFYCVDCNQQIMKVSPSNKKCSVCKVDLRVRKLNSIEIKMHEIQKINIPACCQSSEEPPVFFTTLKDLWDHHNLRCKKLIYRCEGCLYT